MTEFIDIPVPPSFGPPGHQSTPVGDVIRVPVTPIPSPALPRRLVASPPSSDPNLRRWDRSAMESPIMLRNALYTGFPLVVRKRDGSGLRLFTDDSQSNPSGPGLWGWPIAGTPPMETMHARALKRPAWPGLRRQSTMSGACSAVPLPRAGSPVATQIGTYWALIFADGWLIHLFPDGETRTICGPQSWTDRYPLEWSESGGTDKFVVGEFDVLWGMTNDLALHPDDPSKFLVTDALNGRIAVAHHHAPGAGHVRVSTWAVSGPFPYAIDARPGAVYTGDRDSGDLRVYNSADPTDTRVIGKVAGGVASVKVASTGTLSVLEQGGAMRVLEVALDGSMREIWRVPPSVGNPTYYKQLDIDAPPPAVQAVTGGGAYGPLNDMIVGLWASGGASAYRVSFDGTFRSYWKENGAASWGSRGFQGPQDTIPDPGVHYGPSWVRYADEEAAILMSGGVGGAPVLMRPRRPGEPDGRWTSAQGTAATAGRDVWRTGTVPGGPLRPSFWHLAGSSGVHYTGPSPRDGGVPMSPERLVDLGVGGMQKWLAEGGRGETPRPEFLSAAGQKAASDVLQFLRFPDDRALYEGVTVPEGPPDPPPPDVTGPDMQITGVPTLPVAEDFLVSVVATDPAGVTSVALAVDSDPSSPLTAAPYRWAVDVDPLGEGSHTLTFTATDTLGNARAVVAAFVVDRPDPPAEDDPFVTIQGQRYELVPRP